VTDRVRLFVALDFPAAVKDAVAAVASKLSHTVPDARWVPRDNVHVTTTFLGWVEGDRVSEIAEAAAEAAGGMLPFDARLGDLGAFPSTRRARVVWIGIDDPAGGCAAAAAACEDAVERRGVGAERRPFVPHLTIARLRVPAPVALPEAIVPGLRFTVDRLTLFRSHMRRPAPAYEELAVYPFGLNG